jgi:hypothetical protein
MKYKLRGYPEHVNQLQKQTRLSELVSVMLGGFSTKASFSPLPLPRNAGTPGPEQLQHTLCSLLDWFHVVKHLERAMIALILINLHV